MSDTVTSEMEAWGDQRHRDMDPISSRTVMREAVIHSTSTIVAKSPLTSSQDDSLSMDHKQKGEMNILEEALKCTQGDRQAAYGSPAVNWARTAEIASAILGKPLTPSECVQVAMAMKLARLRQTPNHRDSFVDLAGYAWVWSEVVA